MTSASAAGLPDDLALQVVPLPRGRALGRTAPLATPLSVLIDPTATDPGWREQPLPGHRLLQWARDVPGLYAADGPALTTSAHHAWVGEPGDDDLVIDARHAPAWLLLPAGDHVLALHLHGAEVGLARVPLGDCTLPRPPAEAWGLRDQPDWLQQRTARDLARGSLRRAAALGRLLRLRTAGRSLAALQADPTAGLRRWWRQVPRWLTARIEAEAVAACAALDPHPTDLPHLLLRDDLACVRWLLRVHPGAADALDRRLAAVDTRPAVAGSDALDPQLTAAGWRTPDAWWAAP